MQKIFISLLVTLSIVCSSNAVFSQSDAAEKRKQLLKEFNYQDNIIYKTINGGNLGMIVFLPAGKNIGKMPVMLFTHGGGWSGGDRYVVLKKNFAEPMKAFLNAGIACVSIEYRLSKGTSTVSDAVADCKDAGKYLIKNADQFGFDTSRMGVWGGSAGGHLSLMTGLADDSKFIGLPEFANIHSEYKCIVSYYPQTTFAEAGIINSTGYFNPDKLNKMFGKEFETNSEMARSLSPVEYIKKGNPPVLLLHGTADSTISFSNSSYFIAKAKEHGTQAELLTVKNGGHGFGGKNVTPSAAEINKRASDFIIKHLLYKKQ